MAKKNSQSGGSQSPRAKQPEGAGSTGIAWAHTTLFVVDGLLKFAAKTLWPIVSVFGMYFAYLSILALAGKNTNANIIANIAAAWGLDTIIPYIAGAGGLSYGVYERKLRIKSVTNLRKENEQLELAIDPNRSSSGLLPGGLMPQEELGEQ